MLDLGRTLLQSAERSPNALAIVDGILRLTYAQWFERIGKVCRALHELGLRRGDHLAVVLQNRWEMASLHWACQLAGVVVTPLNWRAKGDELEYCLRDAQAKAIAYEAISGDAVAAAPSAAALPCIGVGEVPATISFDHILSSASIDVTRNACHDDISIILYTSGTTGKPKGVPRRHSAERAAALAHVAQNAYLRGERTLGVMPLYHTMGVRSLLASALVDGTFVCMPRFDAAQALRLIEQEQITNLYLVPTLYHDLLAHADFAPSRVASCRKLGFAGAPMPAALLARLDAAFQPQLLVNHYGSSEVYTFTIEQRAAAKPGSAGKAGINARMRVVRLGTASPVELAKVGEEGQIIADMNGDEAFEGYWQRPDADAKALRDGWYFSGDTGYLDADGDLFVTGRVDDMIISGGENISPVNIESVLSLHPAVDEVAVAGVSDERWGQRVVAFVRRRQPVQAAALEAYCRQSALANYQRPREYVFVKQIPKSPVGKILRRKLVAGDYEVDAS